MTCFRRLLLAVMVCLLSDRIEATPISALQGLQSIDIFEQTGGVIVFNFAPDDAALLTRIGDLGVHYDFAGSVSAGEFYDVYYSDADGTFNVNGAFITADVVFPLTNDSGGNIAGVRLNFDGFSELADVMTHCVTNGTYGFLSYCTAAADGSLATATLLGNTDANVTRLSVTVGLSNNVSDVPEPGTLALIGSGLTALWSRRRRRA